MRVVLLNDCADSRHFGSKLVTSAFKEHFEKRGVELLGTFGKREPWDLESGFNALMDKADLVVVNAEGVCHHDNHQRLLKVGYEYPAVFLNAVWQANSYAKHALEQFDYVSVRESMSYDNMAQFHDFDAHVVPDIIFTHAERIAAMRSKTPIGTFITDSSTREKPSQPVSAHPRDPEYVEKMAKSADAVCGRFHAICIAAMLGMPFTTNKANTHKNEGLIRDMNRSSVEQYVAAAPGHIDRMFDHILR